MTGISLPKKIAASPSALPVVKKRRRVLMVGMHLTETRGGISTLINEILRSSLNDDFDFDYIASQSENCGKFAKARLATRAILQFVGKCLRRSPELVYVHLGSNASLYRESIFIRLAKFFNLKIIAHFHAGDFDNYYPRQNFFGRRFIRRAIRSSDNLIAVSEDSAECLGKLVGAPERVTIVPNGIKTSEFDFSPERESVDGFVRILFVGAIGKLKGERDLIRALQILREERGVSNLKVSFLGYGAESLQPLCDAAGIGDAVEFLGAVALGERFEFYRRADIFALPTYGEAMSMSIIEAMAAGLPVVTTRVGGNPEQIENGANGWLVAPGDVIELAGKIEILARNETMRRAFGADGKRRARANFDIRVCAEKLRECLSAAQ